MITGAGSRGITANPISAVTSYVSFPFAR